MIRSFLVAGIAASALSVSASAANGGTNGCRTMLSSSDARLLAAATPNARAFRENLHASLSTELAGVKPGGAVAVRVVAHEPGRGETEVGVYTVNLRNGHVTDDDQEPADDAETQQVRARLMARHCN